MDNILLKVIELVVIIAVTLIMRYGIPLLKTWAEEMKLTGVMKWVAKAVEAAEQMNKEAGSGAEKKAIVTEFLKEILAAKNSSSLLLLNSSPLLALTYSLSHHHLPHSHKPLGNCEPNNLGRIF